MRHLKQSYSDILSMPTYERRFYLKSLKNEHEKMKSEMDESVKNRINSKNGTRTSTISGDALKNKFKTGEIPT